VTSIEMCVVLHITSSIQRTLTAYIYNVYELKVKNI